MKVARLHKLSWYSKLVTFSQVEEILHSTIQAYCIISCMDFPIGSQ